MSLAVDPLGQKGFLSERIQQTAYGYLVREDYAHEMFPSFRYFVKIKEDDDWEAMSGQAVAYDKNFRTQKLIRRRFRLPRRFPLGWKLSGLER